MQIFEQQEDLSLGPKSPSFQRNNNVLVPLCPIPYLFIDSRNSFSYNKLPPQPLKLTVIKLDGTSFEIEVLKTGSVAQLKQAVEAAFSHLPKKGPRKVSWFFVWGHFCLCYDGQKLLNDTDDIGCYGIKDGDKLHFVRHISICYNMVKERSEEEDLDLDEPPPVEPSEERQLRSQEVDKYNQRGTENQEEVLVGNGDQVLVRNCRFKLVQLFRGWFSYHKLPNSDARIDEQTNTFRFSFSSLGSFKDLLIYSRKYDFPREALKAE